LFFRYGSLLKLNTDFLHIKPAEPDLLPRESLWPENLVLNFPQGNQAVHSGKRLFINCTAPRYSKVTAFYGSNYTTLHSDCNGSYSGYLTAEAPIDEETYTAPPLVCSEKFGMLTVKLIPFTTTSVQPSDAASIDEIQWLQTDTFHQIDFFTKTPCAVSFHQLGDVLEVQFAPCRLGVLFDDDYFQRMSVEQTDEKTTYRLVFPDDQLQRHTQLYWLPDKITLQIQTTLQVPPEDDP